MAISRAKKEEILKKLIDRIKSAKSVIFADYQGLSVKDMKELRSKLKEDGVQFQVAKKTLMRLAAKESGFAEIPDECLEGPVAAAFSMEDEIVAAKLLHQFGKKNKNLKLRGALFDGRVLSISETKELAVLPGKEELFAKFVYLLNFPITGFHGVCHNTISGFVRVLDAIRKKQEQAA